MNNQINKDFKKDKQMIKRIIMLVIIIIIILLLLIKCNQKDITFMEYAQQLYGDFNEFKIDEGQVEEKYLNNKFKCSKVNYYGEIIEFYDCEVEENKIEELCIYDGDELYCNPNKEDEIKDFNVEFKSDYDKVSNKDIEVGISYDDNTFTDIKYCNTTNNICIPNKEIDKNNIIDINTESSTNKICVSSKTSDGDESEIVCSDEYIIDKTPPTIIDPIFEGILGNDGWYVSDVNIKKLEAVDNNSGVVSTDINKTVVNYNTDKEVIVVTATDNAGNKISKEYILKVDKTLPTTGSMKVEGIVGNNNWYRSEVKITYNEGSDNESGYDKSILSDESINEDTKGKVVSLTTIDKAGNKTTVIRNVKVDSTDPLITGLSDIYVNRFENIDYYRGVEAIDLISGVDGEIFINTDEVDMNNPGTYYAIYEVWDKAGNKKIAKRKIIVSEEAMNVTFNTKNIHNENFWYNKDINITIDVEALKDTDTVKYCLTTSSECIPDTTYNNEATISNESDSNKVCMLIEYSKKETSDIVCSDKYQLDKTKPKTEDLGDERVNIYDYILADDIDIYDDVSKVADIKITGDVILQDELLIVDTNTAGVKYISYEITDYASNTVKVDRIITVVSQLPDVYFDFSENENNGSGWFKDDVKVIVEGNDYSNTFIKDYKWCITNDDTCTPVIQNTNEIILKESTDSTKICAAVVDNASQESEVKCTEVIKIDKKIPEITQINDINIDFGIYMDLNEYFKVTFGISGGNFECDIKDTSLLSVGVHDLACVATSNSLATTLYKTTINVKEVIKSMVSGNEFRNIVGSEINDVNLIVFDSTISDDYNTAPIKYDLSTDKSNYVVGYIEYLDDMKILHIQANEVIKANSDMSYMFANLPLSTDIIFRDDIDTSQTINMSHMFENSNELLYLDLLSMNFDNVSNIDNMFNFTTLIDVIYVKNQATADKLNSSLNKQESLIFQILPIGS